MTANPTDTPLRTQEEIAARVKALESVLIEKGVVTTKAVDRLVEVYENEVGPQDVYKRQARRRRTGTRAAST